MGLNPNHNLNIFRKYDIEKNGKNVTVHVQMFGDIGRRLDIAQDALDSQIWTDMQQYMPRDTGNLIFETDILNKSTRGEVYLYPNDSDYGHYQYEGYVYVDPVYGVGGFYSPNYGWWSRPNVEKVKSDRKLVYTNPMAQSHWDEVAFANHGQTWLKIVKQILGG